MTARVTIHQVAPYGEAPVDVVVENGTITAITLPTPNPGGDGHLDGQGLVMLPALVDPHTHLREPGGEEAETVASGSTACAAGGYSDVFAMANTDPTIDTTEQYRAATERNQNRPVRIEQVAALSVGLDGRELTDIPALMDAGAVMFSDDGHCLDNAALVRQAMRQLAAGDGILAQHSQSTSLAGGAQIDEEIAARTGLAPWPLVGEDVVVARDVMLALDTGARLHVCHVTSPRSLEIVRWGKQQGGRITAEVTPHHLWLDHGRALGADPRFKVNPPLRSAQVAAVLRDALRAGVVDVVGTDHAPHAHAKKACGWPAAAFGMTGVETALAVVAQVFTADGTTDWRAVARVMSEEPARLGGISNRAGRPLRAGEPATLCLVSSEPWPVRADQLRSKSHNTPFVDMEFGHRVVLTMVDGAVTFAG